MMPPTSWRSLSGLSRVPRRSIERFFQCQCRDTRVALQCDPSHRRSVMLRGTATDGAACFGCTARLMSARRTAELVEVIIQMAVCAGFPAALTACRAPPRQPATAQPVSVEGQQALCAWTDGMMSAPARFIAQSAKRFFHDAFVATASAMT